MSAYSTAVLADSPSAYWRLNEASGNLIDSSGNSHTLNTISGMTYGVTGLIASDATDNAVSFAGSGSASGTYNPSTTAPWTLEFWMKPTSVAAPAGTTLIGESGVWRLGFGNTNGKFRLTTTGHTDYDFTTAVFATGTTYHVVLIFGSSSCDLYVNGAFSQTVSGSGINGPNVIALGTNLNGVLDEVAVYVGVSLSSARILAHYNAASVASPPANTVAPAVTGTTTVGQTLTCSTGTWTDDVGTHVFTYQWKRDVQGSGSYSAIPLATSSTYVLTDSDDASHIKCTVTDTDTNGATAADSNIVGTVIEPVPTNSVAPTVSGGTTVGSTLTATSGTWTHMAGFGTATYAFQWTRDGSNIAAAVSTTYVTQAADIGHAVGVKVTPTNTGGSGTPQASSNTITVTAASSSFVGGGSIIALFDALEW